MGGVVSVIASTHPEGDLSANTESPPTRRGGRSAAHGGGDVFLHQISRELVNEPRLRWHFPKHRSRASDWGKAERAVPSLLSAFLFCGSVLPLTS